MLPGCRLGDWDVAVEVDRMLKLPGAVWGLICGRAGSGAPGFRIEVSGRRQAVEEISFETRSVQAHPDSLVLKATTAAAHFGDALPRSVSWLEEGLPFILQVHRSSKI